MPTLQQWAFGKYTPMFVLYSHATVPSTQMLTWQLAAAAWQRTHLIKAYTAEVLG